MFGTIEQARNMGAVAVGATIYFGSDESTRQITEIAESFAYAHELGMATILWCYLRNSKFKTDEGDMHEAADLDRTGKSSRRDDPSRHHQAKAADAETAATRR